MPDNDNEDLRKLPFAAIFQNRCFEKLQYSQEKHVLESLSNKVAGLLKRDSNTCVFLRILRIFKAQLFL